MKPNIDCSSCFEQDNSDIARYILQSNKKDENVSEFFKLIQSADPKYIDDLYTPAPKESDVAVKSDCYKYPEQVLQTALSIENDNSKEHRVEFGTFIPINHYSCKIDNKLFIWPMEDIVSPNQSNNQNSNIIRIQEKCELISCVACGPADQIPFKEKATHVIVVATNRFISIYPVVDKHKIVTKDPIRAPLRICIVTSIAISDKGKIFLGSDTGHIYLVSYRLSNWNQEKCVIDIHNLTQWPIIPHLQRLIPYPFPNVTNLSICTLQNDKIYIAALDTKSRIIFYRYKCVLGKHKIREMSRFMIEKKDQEKNGTIVKIISVPISDSTSTRFVVFTSNSYRLFFNVRKNEKDKNEIYLQQERCPPTYCSSEGRKNGLIDAHYSLGVSVFLYRRNLVIARTTQNPHIDKMNPIEMVTIYDIDTNALIFTRGDHIFSNHPFHLFNNEMLWQHLTTPSKGYLMTAKGAHVITFSLPVDRLSSLLTESHGNYTEKVNDWMHEYNEGSESSACTLLLASRSAALERSNALFCLYQYTNQLISQEDESISKMMSSNSNSSANSNTTINSVSNNHSFSNVNSYYNRFYNRLFNELMTNRILPQSCLAFVRRAARLMKPIWDFPIFSLVNDPTVKPPVENYQINPIFKQLPTNFLSNLSDLIDLAKEYLKIKNHSGTKEEGIHLIETTTLNKFISYMTTVIATITFIQIMKDQPTETLTNAMKNIGTEYKKVLTVTKFGESNDKKYQQEGNSLFESLREFAASLFRNNQNLQSLQKRLIDECPDFFNEADAKILDALELIEKADKKNIEAQKPKFQNARSVFVRYANRPLKLKQICQIFEDFNFYEGIVDVCSSRAYQLDPERIALQWYKNGRRLEDYKGMEAFDKRYNCYWYIFIVKDLSQIFKHLVKNTDELLHICFYEHLIYRVGDEGHNLLMGLFSCIIKEAAEQKDHNLSTASYLEAYLKEMAPQHLWKYQSLNKHYDLAAKTLLELIKDKEDKCFMFIKEMNSRMNIVADDDDDESEIPNLKKRATLLLKVISFSRGSGNIRLLNEAQRLYQLASIQMSYNEKVIKDDELNHSNTFDGQTHYILNQQELFNNCCSRGFWDLVLKLLSFCSIETPNKEMTISRVWTNFLTEDIDQYEFQSAQHIIITLVNNMYKNPNVRGTGNGSRIETQNEVMNLSIILPLFEDFKYNHRGQLMWACDTLLKCGLKPQLLYRQYMKMILEKSPESTLDLEQKADFIYICAQIIKKYSNSANHEHWKLESFKEAMEWFTEKGKDMSYYDDCLTYFNEISIFMK